MDTLDVEKIRHEFSQAKNPELKLKYALKLAEYDPEMMRPVIQLLEPSVVDAPSVITLKLGSTVFNPLVAYPLFPADFIIGYKNPHITFEFDEATLLLLIDVKYDGEPQPNATNILAKVKDNFPSDSIFTERNAWNDAVLKEKNNVLELQKNKGNQCIGTFVSSDGQRIKATAMDFSRNKDYLRRVFLFSLFFIEGAVLPDYTDLGWKTIVLQRDDDTNMFYGYCSLYMFWSYQSGSVFDKQGPTFRYRIAQFLILPPFQRKKMASELYKAVLKDAQANRNISDIQVEDASLEFDILCQRVNYQLLSQSPDTQELLEHYADDHDVVVDKLQKITKLSSTAVMQAAEVYYYNEIRNVNNAILKTIIQNRIYASKFPDLAHLEHHELRQTLDNEYQQEIKIIQVVLGEQSYDELFGNYEEEEDGEEVEDELEEVDDLTDSMDFANQAKKQKF